MLCEAQRIVAWAGRPRVVCALTLLSWARRGPVHHGGARGNDTLRNGIRIAEQ